MTINEEEKHPEKYLLEEMLIQYYKEKDFYSENFAADEAIKVFKKDQNQISDFLLKIN